MLTRKCSKIEDKLWGNKTDLLGMNDLGPCTLESILSGNQANVLNDCNRILKRDMPTELHGQYYGLIISLGYKCEYIKDGDCPYMFQFGNNLFCSNKRMVEEELMQRGLKEKEESGYSASSTD